MDALAARWHQGCEDDPIRNEFIIPRILSEIESFRPKRILDIGCGTGYIPARLLELQEACLDMTLIDTDAERLSYAKSIPSLENANIIETNFFLDEHFCSEFDLVLLCNVLVELRLDEIQAHRIFRTVAKGGHLIVAHPDTLYDVAQVKNNLSEGFVSNYTNANTSLKKVDRFTGAEYPFFAHRISSIIFIMIDAGFRLVGFERMPAIGKHIVLVFER